MLKYCAYNLTIQSEIPLPLPQCQSPEQPDIIVTIGETDEPETLSRTYDGVWYAHGDESLFIKWDLKSYKDNNNKNINPLATH